MIHRTQVFWWVKDPKKPRGPIQAEARCSCGWVSVVQDSKQAAHVEADAHVQAIVRSET